jgi:hypothetical protein
MTIKKKKSGVIIPAKIKKEEKEKNKSKEKIVGKSGTIKKKALNGPSIHAQNNNNPSEVKISKNVDTISRLINNSNDILAEQNSILEKYQEITKKITSSDFEIERLLSKNQNDEFQIFLEKYGTKLNQIMQKLKIHEEEMEEIKCKLKMN